MTEDELQDWKKFLYCEGHGWLGGWLLQVDLVYPKELHDLHNDYSLAPKRLTVNNVEKLITNLNDKTNYVIYYKNLELNEFRFERGISIHRGNKFEKSPWLKPFIELNTNLSTQAKNEFEKNFFKLMNNSPFGKTMENMWNRADIGLVKNKEKARKLAAKPNFQHCTIFDESLVAIHMKKAMLTFNKPVYLKMCILDLTRS